MTNKAYASFWIRLLAEVLDILIFSLDVAIFGGLIYFLAPKNPEILTPLVAWYVAYFVLHCLMLFFLKPYLINKVGGTPGKLITGIKIINEENDFISFKDALFREYIGKAASAVLFGLGYFWIFKDPKRQAWHDHIAGTFVVKR